MIYNKEFFMNSFIEMSSNKYKKIDDNTIQFDGFNIIFSDELLYDSDKKSFDEKLVIKDDKEITYIIEGNLRRLVDEKYNINGYKCCFSELSVDHLLNMYLTLFENKGKLFMNSKSVSSIDFLDILRNNYSHYKMLTIISKQKLNDSIEKEITKTIYSIKYQLLTNYDIRMKIVGDKEEFINRYYTIDLNRIRNFRIKTIGIDDEIINENMIEYFSEAYESSNPKIIYLSFYNVLEYSFDALKLSKTLKEIHMIMEENIDSGKKYSKIKRLVNEKENSLLIYLIDNYVNKVDLKDFIEKNKYYMQSAPYIENTNIELNESIVKRIADRIYKVRCAIVHTK